MNVPEQPNVDEIMNAAKKEWFLGIALFVVFVGAVGGIWWGYYRHSDQAPITNNQTIVTETPKSSVAPVVEVKPVFVVWNASGMAGAAGKMADKLKAQGYEVVEIKNAPKEQVGTTVEISPKMESQSEKILEIVGEGADPARSLLAGSEKYNVRVVIGK